jgi:hypothetical protein
MSSRPVPDLFNTLHYTLSEIKQPAYLLLEEKREVAKATPLLTCNIKET